MLRFFLSAAALIGLIVGASASPNPLVDLVAFNPIQAFSAPTGSTPFTALHTYYMAPTTASPAGNDTNSGTDAAHPWATPNHSVACGDVIIAAAGTYSSSGLGTFGSVSGCPSSSAGINGTGGGIYHAVLLCAGTLGSCDVPWTGTGLTWAADVTSSNWAIEGFQIHGNTGQGAFVADALSINLHHISFINNIAYNVGIGFGAQGGNLDHAVPGVGFDYVAFIGNIAQNAEQNTTCTAAIVMVAPTTIDTNVGTHFLMDGNFAYDQPNNGCSIDIENFMFDSWDVHGVTNQAVAMNNVGWSAWRFGFQDFTQNFNPVSAMKHYILNNTLYNNTLIGSSGFGGLNIAQNNSTAPTITVLNNITTINQTGNCALQVGGDAVSGFTPASIANVTLGTTGNENVAYNSANTSNSTCFNNSYAGTNANFLVNPTFNNTSDLLTNWVGVPNCTGFENVTQCMGYDAYTSTLTTLTPIYDLTPTGTYSSKGFQKPSTTCASSGIVSTYYPSWLKGIVYLHWNGAGLEQKHGLVTTPCGL